MTEMMYWEALEGALELARAEGVAPHFIETNCSFATDDAVLRYPFPAGSVEPTGAPDTIVSRMYPITVREIGQGIIKGDERIITIEDSAELQLKQPHVVRLESRPPNIEGEGQITIRDLVKNSLRMRPDRIVVVKLAEPSLSIKKFAGSPP